VIENITALCGGFLVGWICRARLLPIGPPPGSYGPRLDPGRVQRGNGNGGPATPKPGIVPKPQPPRSRVIDAYGRMIGYPPLSGSREDSPWVHGPANPAPEEP
jgi:hypothetical protein